MILSRRDMTARLPAGIRHDRPRWEELASSARQRTAGAGHVHLRLRWIPVPIGSCRLIRWLTVCKVRRLVIGAATFC